MDEPGEQASDQPRVLLIDTNCFLRLYYSPLRPFLGVEVGEYKILTLATLIDEFRESERLMKEYAWLQEDLAREDSANASVQLSEDDLKDVIFEKKQLRPYANSLLEKHCKKEGIGPKNLSDRDVSLLASAAVLEAVIATDEWPLTLVIEDLLSVEGEYEIQVITSLDVLHLLETNGMLTADDRKETVRSWQRCDEKLPRDWRNIYRRLFNEAPPTLQ